MSEKNLKTRVVNKHDTETNWNKATNFIPKAGEVIIYDPDTSHTKHRLKIGDGTTAVNDLSFITDEVLVTSINGKTGNVVLNADNIPMASTNLTTIKTKFNSVETSIEDLHILVVSFSAFDSLPQTVSNKKITTNMVCLKAVLSTPTVQEDNWTVDTNTAGQVTVNGTISGSTTLMLYLAKIQ